MRARTTKKEPKPPMTPVLRVGVAIPKEVRKRAMALAKEENRSFNNFINVLIDREWDRRMQKVTA